MYDAKFDANKGVFHFVFADQEDEYFDPSYLMLDFQTALWCRIKDAQYKYIIMISHTGEGTGEISIELTGVKESTIANLSEEEQPKDTRSDFMKFLTRPIGGKKPKEIKENSASFDATVSRKRLRVPGDKWDSYLRKLFNFMDDHQRVALVLPIDLFVRLGETPERKSALERRKEQYGAWGNIVVITSPLQLSPQSDCLTGGMDCILNSGQNFSIFSDKNLFKEIEQMALRHENDKVIRPYELLAKQECLGERLCVWDNMTQEDIERAIRYALLRRDDMVPLVSVELCAALFQLLRDNAKLRKRYGGQIPIEPEKMNLKTIRQYIASCDIRELNEVLQSVASVYKQESGSSRTPSASALLSHYLIDRSRMLISCRREDAPKVVSLIDRFKEYIDVKYEGESIDESRYRQITELHRFFRQPMLPSRQNKNPMTYIRLKNGVKEYTVLKELITEHLEHRDACNCWDEGIVLTLLAMFWDMREVCFGSGDWYNDHSENRFLAYVQILETMRKRSEDFERDREGWEESVLAQQNGEGYRWVSEVESAVRSENAERALKIVADRLQNNGF